MIVACVAQPDEYSRDVRFTMTCLFNGQSENDLGSASLHLR